MRIIATISFLLAFNVFCLGQKQANIWYFGNKLGLDFNSIPPTLLLDGQIGETSPTNESTASIADENGKLLFYTDGRTVWNKLHQIMPNGINLYGNYSTTQTLIVPKPSSNSIYYIFTASPVGNSDYTPSEKRGFHYSIVDMTLDGGLGDVVTKNILLTSSTTEKMAATYHVNGIDVWVVMHEWDSRKFRSYLITTNGINEAPIISETGIVHTGPSIEFFQETNSMGQMKISSNGERLALVTYYDQNLEVFNFNPANGTLSLLSSISLAIPDGHLYGLEFSPSSRYLYVTQNSCNLLQIDLNSELKTTNVIKVSTTPPCNNITQLQLSPDGKIYLTYYAKYFIGAIHKPNDSGELCEYEDRAIELPLDGTHYSNSGLPNFISSYFYNPELYPPRPYFKMPNVFTPNNDGLNERFVSMENYNIERITLFVYNRWGERIFETNNVTTGWDGGEFSSGVYFWYASYVGVNGKLYSQKGQVQLIR